MGDDRAERASATMNHLHEGMPELVTREDAIEAAEYWQMKYDQAMQLIEATHTGLLLGMVRLVTAEVDGK